MRPSPGLLQSWQLARWLPRRFGVGEVLGAPRRLERLRFSAVPRVHDAEMILDLRVVRDRLGATSISGAASWVSPRYDGERREAARQSVPGDSSGSIGDDALDTKRSSARLRSVVGANRRIAATSSTAWNGAIIGRLAVFGLASSAWGRRRAPRVRRERGRVPHGSLVVSAPDIVGRQDLTCWLARVPEAAALTSGRHHP